MAVIRQRGRWNWSRNRRAREARGPHHRGEDFGRNAVAGTRPRIENIDETVRVARPTQLNDLHLPFRLTRRAKREQVAFSGTGVGIIGNR